MEKQNPSPEDPSPWTFHMERCLKLFPDMEYININGTLPSSACIEEIDISSLIAVHGMILTSGWLEMHEKSIKGGHIFKMELDIVILNMIRHCHIKYDNPHSVILWNWYPIMKLWNHREGHKNHSVYQLLWWMQASETGVYLHWKHVNG